MSTMSPNETFYAIPTTGIVGVTAALLVAISGNLHASSASTTLSSDDGAGTITEKRKFTPNNLVGQSRFGEAIAIEGDLAAVGAAPGSVNDPALEASVRIFERTSGDEWEASTRLRQTKSTHFGRAIALGPEVATVGFTFGQKRGARIATYRFDEGSRRWESENDLNASDTVTGGFGSSVSLTGRHVLAGAPLAANSAGTKTGAAYLFELSSPENVHNRPSPKLRRPTTKRTDDDRTGDVFVFAAAIVSAMLMVGCCAARNDDLHPPDRDSA